MNRRGRKPAGLELVDSARGSDVAKDRVRLILRTLSGEVTIEEAHRELRLSRTRFYELRHAAIDALVEANEPRPVGRPRHRSSKRDAEVLLLEEENAELRRRLRIEEARANVSRVVLVSPAVRRGRRP